MDTITFEDRHIARMKSHVANWLREGKAARDGMAANLADAEQNVYYTNLEGLVEAIAKQRVAGMIQGALDKRGDDAVQDIHDEALRNALSAHHINSTSAVTVVGETFEREAWVRIASILRGGW